MLSRKCNLIVGLTTIHNEMLRISVPALGRLQERFLLVVHNDNPAVRIRRRDIRRLGYRGPLHIINSNARHGILRARMDILTCGLAIAPRAAWIMFVNPDDVVIDTSIPNVRSDNFAVVQNALLCRGRLSDLMRGRDIMNDIDGENIVLQRPSIGIAGTLLRTDIVRGTFAYVDTILDQIYELDRDLEYAPPVDALMWSFVNMYAHFINPDAAPIFMDRINYIKNGLDHASSYDARPLHPPKAGAARYARAIARYDALIHAALTAARSAEQ